MKRKLNGSIKSNLSIITKRILIIFIIFTLFFTISSLALSLSTTFSPWPMFRHDPQHTGRSPYKGAEIDIFKWKFKTGEPNELFYSSPAIGSNGTIYIGSWDGNFYAINPNGTLKWKFGTGVAIFSSPAIGSNGTIYFGAADDYFYAINPNGTLKWKLGIGGKHVSSPAIGSDGTIYVGRGGNLCAINPNGTLKWKFRTGDTIESSPAIGSDGTIYVGSNDGNLYAINSNGTLKWRFGTGRRVESSPAIGSDGTIYVGAINGNFYAINPNGTLKWKLDFNDTIESSPAIGSDGTIYVGSSDYGAFYAINPNGRLKWKLGASGVTSSPAIGSDGTIYVGFGDSLYAINPNGSILMSFGAARSIFYSSPAIGSDGTIYVGFSDSLYAIGGTDSSLQDSDTTCFLTGSLHCPDKRGYPCNSCSSAPGYINHFKGFNVLTTNKDCYVKLIYNNGAYIGNQSNCKVTIKGKKWLGLENDLAAKLVEEISSERFNFKPANKFVEKTMDFPGDNYKYEFANEGKEFRLYLPRNREEAFKAVPWKNITVEIKNKETSKVFKYKFEKGIFPLTYSWSNGVANYGQCVWWAAKRWVEEVDSKTLFPFYPPSPEAVNVKTIDSNYQPKKYDVLINYDPGGLPEHYGFVEKVEGDKVYITQFNFIKPGEVYNYIIMTWNGNATSLFYSNNFYDEYYFKYYYRK